MLAVASLIPYATTGAADLSLQSLKPLLGRCRAFYPRLAAIGGSTKAGVLLSQLCYWTQHPPAGAGDRRWIQKTADEWYAETGLTRREQGTVRSRLVELGLIEVVRRGVPARLHYRVIPDVLDASLRELTGTKAIAGVSLEELLGAPQPHYQVLTCLTGNLHAGLLLSRALHFLRHAQTERERAGFLRSSAISREALGLGRRAWEIARRDLVAGGWWTEGLVGVPARLEVRVHIAPLHEQLAQFDRGQATRPMLVDANRGAVPNVTTGLHKSAHLVVTKPPSQLSGNVPTSYDETAELLKKRIKNYRIEPPPEDPRDRKTAREEGGRREDLIFPPGLDPEQRMAARRMLSACAEVAQAMLDELAARLKAREIRRSPIGYLRALVERYRNGSFTPKLGGQIAHARQRRIDALSTRRQALDGIEPTRREQGTSQHRERIAQNRAAIGQLIQQIRRRPRPAPDEPSQVGERLTGTENRAVAGVSKPEPAPPSCGAGMRARNPEMPLNPLAAMPVELPSHAGTVARMHRHASWSSRPQPASSACSCRQSYEGRVAGAGQPLSHPGCERVLQL
jgi:hypothetical protein